MTVESEADLASMFNTDEFATSARYIPQDGVPSTVTIIFSEPSIDARSGLTGIQVHQRLALVRASDFDLTPVRGDKIDIADVTYNVRKVRPDATRRVYTLELGERE